MADAHSINLATMWLPITVDTSKLARKLKEGGKTGKQEFKKGIRVRPANRFFAHVQTRRDAKRGDRQNSKRKLQESVNPGNLSQLLPKF
jgi:hypothetical protein